MHHIRHIGGVVHLDHFPVGLVDAIDHGRGGSDHVEIELAVEALLNDFHMQQAEEAAAETVAECCRGFGLVMEAGIVEAEFAKAVAQMLELGAVSREQGAEDDRNGRLEAGQHLTGRFLGIGDGVTDPCILNVLHTGGQEAHLAGAELADNLWFG